jgi:hypothetical protein
MPSSYAAVVHLLPFTVLVFLDWLASPDGAGWVVAYAAALSLTIAGLGLARADRAHARAALMLAAVLALPASLLGLAIALGALPRVLDQSGPFTSGDVIGFTVYGSVVLCFLLATAIAQIARALRHWQPPASREPPSREPASREPASREPASRENGAALTRTG